MKNPKRAYPKIVKRAKSADTDCTPGSKNEHHNNNLTASDSNNNGQFESFLEAARFYVNEMGFSVIPTIPGTKKPAIPDYQYTR